MSEPAPGPIRTDAPVVPTGGDSVSDLHRAHMTQMNDPVMLTADGVDDTAVDEPGESGSDSVQGLHQAVMREHAEPRDGFEPVPFWVAVVCGGLLAWGGYYIGAYTADFRADVYDRADLKDVAPPAPPEVDPKTVEDLKRVGERTYTSICQACHQADGKGQPGQYPPLDGSNWVAGPEASPARLARIVLYGLKDPVEVKTAAGTLTFGTPGKPVMQPHAHLKDRDLAGALTYIRNNWSNKADPDNAKPALTSEVIRAARMKEGKTREQMTAAELLKIDPKYADPPPKR
jgi:mono/diheme cytochrome c family protein